MKRSIIICGALSILMLFASFMHQAKAIGNENKDFFHYDTYFAFNKRVCIYEDLLFYKFAQHKSIHFFTQKHRTWKGKSGFSLSYSF